jgi:hypothetical protein
MDATSTLGQPRRYRRGCSLSGRAWIWRQKCRTPVGFPQKSHGASRDAFTQLPRRTTAAITVRTGVRSG